MIEEQTALLLAEFSAGLRYEDIPVEVLEKAKQLVLDIMRLSLQGSRLPCGQRTREVFRQMGGREESTVLGFGDRLPAIHAAYVNGTMASELENDDTHLATIHHPGVSVVPAVLAVAERQGLGGKALLKGMIAGYEVITRVGSAVQPSLFADRGFHATGVLGHFGAATGASNLLELSVEKTVHALALAASYASGLSNWLTGGMVKFIHPGKAAKGGIEAALLAAAGVTGPREIFEGKHGFCHAYADHFDLKAMTEGLGQEWRTLEVHLKPHCTSRIMQAPIEAIATIASEHSIRPADVASIEVRTSPLWNDSATFNPMDVVEAQASIPFVMATVLFKGGARTLKEFILLEDITQAMENPQVHALVQRIQIIQDPTFSGETANAEVTVRLTDGRTHTKRVDVMRGSPENPFTNEEVRQRFLAQAESVLPRERLVEVADLVDRLEKVKEISEITRLCH